MPFSRAREQLGANSSSTSVGYCFLFGMPACYRRRHTGSQRALVSRAASREPWDGILCIAAVRLLISLQIADAHHFGMIRQVVPAPDIDLHAGR